MKKVFGLLVITALLFLSFGAVSSASDLKVGIIFSIGGLGDESFNDAAFRGLTQAREDFGITFDFVEPADIGEMEEHQRAFAEAGYDLVFAVGFLQESALEEVGRDYPNGKFAIIDGVVDLPNVASLTFKEHEGSFLVGLVAGMMTETNVVGFVGGMEVPIIEKFQVGFEEGVAYVDPAINVLISYAGSFGDPGKGKELAISQFERDADIVYHASGGTGMGVIEAAEEKSFFAIGVDSDQDHLSPGNVLTSMLKRVDVAVYEQVRALVEDDFTSGIISLGIAEDGVGTSDFTHTAHLVPEEVFGAIEEAKEKIIAGEIVVTDPTQ